MDIFWMLGLFMCHCQHSVVTIVMYLHTLKYIVQLMVLPTFSSS